MKENLQNPLGRTLGLIHGNQHGNRSDTPTGKDTTNDEQRESGSNGSQGNTSSEDANAEDDGPLLSRKSVVRTANRVPKNVPADKMETTRECWDEVMMHTPVAGLGFPKTYNRSSMVWMPEIAPVS